MKKLSLEDLHDGNLKRLLNGEDLSKFQDLMDFELKSKELFMSITEEFSLPKERTPEAQEEWFKTNFTKPEQTVIRFMVDWEREILLAIIRIVQSGRLVISEMPNKRVLKKVFVTEREWHELMLSLFLNEVYRFKCRVENHLNGFKNCLNDLALNRDSYSTLRDLIKTTHDHLVNWFSHRESVRGKDVHRVGYVDENLDKMEVYEAAIRLKVGGGAETWKYEEWLKWYKLEFKRNWRETTKKEKNELLVILNDLSWTLRFIIHQMSPKFKSVFDWEEFDKRFPQKTKQSS